MYDEPTLIPEETLGSTNKELPNVRTDNQTQTLPSSYRGCHPETTTTETLGPISVVKIWEKTRVVLDHPTQR